MKRLHCKWHRITSLVIIIFFLLTITVKILEKTRPLSEPLVIISSANELTELTMILSLDNTTTTNNLSSSSNPSVVKININYTNQHVEELPGRAQFEKTDHANKFIFYQAIWNCLCSRRFMYPPSPPNQLQKLNSSCSDEGTHYQSNQKVISMSMFVSPRTTKGGRHSASYYQIGLVENLIKMRKNYPSYSLRIYTNISLLPNSSWCSILCENEDLFWCDVRSTPSHGNLNSMNFRTWRFLPLGDPTVRIFHSRDLDSLIGYRDAAAVQDWLEYVGYKAIQLMRDKSFHHNIPILAGMWGAQNNRLLDKGQGSLLREKIIKSSQLKKNQGSKYWDQIMLASLIVGNPVIARDVVAYDSYHCIKWANITMVRPFPVQRLVDDPERDFVARSRNFTGDAKGKFYNLKERISKCPVECRPSYGKDWIYC